MLILMVNLCGLGEFQRYFDQLEIYMKDQVELLMNEEIYNRIEKSDQKIPELNKKKTIFRDNLSNFFKHLVSSQAGIINHDGFLDYWREWLQVFLQCKIRHCRMAAVEAGWIFLKTSKKHTNQGHCKIKQNMLQNILQSLIKRTSDVDRSIRKSSYAYLSKFLCQYQQCINKNTLQVWKVTIQKNSLIYVLKGIQDIAHLVDQDWIQNTIEQIVERLEMGTVKIQREDKRENGLTIKWKIDSLDNPLIITILQTLIALTLIYPQSLEPHFNHLFTLLKQFDFDRLLFSLYCCMRFPQIYKYNIKEMNQKPMEGIDIQQIIQKINKDIGKFEWKGWRCVSKMFPWLANQNIICQILQTQSSPFLCSFKLPSSSLLAYLSHILYPPYDNLTIFKNLSQDILDDIEYKTKIQQLLQILKKVGRRGYEISKKIGNKKWVQEQRKRIMREIAQNRDQQKQQAIKDLTSLSYYFFIPQMLPLQKTLPIRIFYNFHNHLFTTLFTSTLYYEQYLQTKSILFQKFAQTIDDDKNIFFMWIELMKILSNDALQGLIDINYQIGLSHIRKHFTQNYVIASLLELAQKSTHFILSELVNLIPQIYKNHPQVVENIISSLIVKESDKDSKGIKSWIVAFKFYKQLPVFERGQLLKKISRLFFKRTSLWSHFTNKLILFIGQSIENMATSQKYDEITIFSGFLRNFWKRIDRNIMVRILIYFQQKFGNSQLEQVKRFKNTIKKQINRKAPRQNNQSEDQKQSQSDLQDNQTLDSEQQREVDFYLQMQKKQKLVKASRSKPKSPSQKKKHRSVSRSNSKRGKKRNDL